MDYKLNAGIHKKSFELFYNGGSIWAEHLDSMGNLSEMVMEKFLQDYKQFSKPSSSSFMIINFDETEVTEDIASFVADTLKNCQKRFRRIAFVGVKWKMRRQFKLFAKESGTAIAFINNYEKAKEWVLP